MPAAGLRPPPRLLAPHLPSPGPQQRWAEPPGLPSSPPAVPSPQGATPGSTGGRFPFVPPALRRRPARSFSRRAGSCSSSAGPLRCCPASGLAAPNYKSQQAPRRALPVSASPQVNPLLQPTPAAPPPAPLPWRAVPHGKASPVPGEGKGMGGSRHYNSRRAPRGRGHFEGCWATQTPQRDGMGGGAAGGSGAEQRRKTSILRGKGVEVRSKG